jgi:predicted enzyme related to lactoylglutathione lyase
MLNAGKIVGFVPALDLAKARSFYELILGQHATSQDDFAVIFEANGTMLRITRVQQLQPQPFTILGWDVADIDDSVARLSERGVKFEQYSMPGQDQRGIWKSPSGARVAWFKDPDGNVLSVTQFN